MGGWAHSHWAGAWAAFYFATIFAATTIAAKNAFACRRAIHLPLEPRRVRPTTCIWSGDGAANSGERPRFSFLISRETVNALDLEQFIGDPRFFPRTHLYSSIE